LRKTFGFETPASPAMHGLQLSQRDLALATGAFLLLFVALGTPLSWRREVAPDLVAASAVLALALAVLSAIDIYTYRLPDLITLPLAGLGVFVSTLSGAAPLWWSVASAGLGFAVLAGVAYAYRRLRGRSGLGLGDAKLLAASGAWLGAEALPTVLLWATGPALVCVLIAYWRDRSLTATSRLPFGPFLSFATWLVWLYGPL
jgi:leader peptidase (prepilin peptidase) / N-methyltransferase